MKTYTFESGKYVVERDEKFGTILDVRRNGEAWPVGFTTHQFSKMFHAMLNRIDELEAIAKDAGAVLGMCYPIVHGAGSQEHVNRLDRAQRACTSLHAPEGEL